MMLNRSLETKPVAKVQVLPLILLSLVTLVARYFTLSQPYFVDGPHHVKAIEDGSFVVQPPGYFLFHFSGMMLAQLLHVSPAIALRVLNLSFGVGAVVVFFLLCGYFFQPRHALLLSLTYAASPLVWFVADIHSTYAAMTFFAPLLFLVMEARQQFLLGCLLWGVMTGFRPSDGFFVFPWMLYQSWGHSWLTKINGVVVSSLVLLLWWLPTAQRFGGTFFSPLTASGSTASHHAQGLLATGFSRHAATDFLRGISGMMIAWGLLLPLIAVGAWLFWRRDRLAQSALLWMMPGILFFLLYYMADATYLSFCVVPGFLIVGLLLRRLSTLRQIAVYAAAVVVAIVFFLGARSIPPTSKPRAVLDSYFLKYTAWSLRHQYAPRLAVLLGACGETDVLGDCQ